MARRSHKYPFWNNWRHIAAYVYLAICIFDFMAMPVFYEVANPRTTDVQLVATVQKLPESAQVQALQILHEERTWKSLTLQDGGLFHMAFGAILGVAAFTRGQEKTAYARNGLPYGGYEYDDDDGDDSDNEPEGNDDDDTGSRKHRKRHQRDRDDDNEPYFAPAPPKRMAKTSDSPPTETVEETK